jgi:hypothetical protein
MVHNGSEELLVDKPLGVGGASRDCGAPHKAAHALIAHYHTERNHQGKDKPLLLQQISKTDHDKPVRCRDPLGGLLRYYHQEAA